MNQDMYDNYISTKSLQDEQLSAQKELYAPQLKEQTAQAQAVVITETDPKKVIKEIEYALRNVEEDPTNPEVLRRLGPPKMNKKGINQMKSIARSHVNQNTILSRMENMREVNKITIHLADNVVDDLALNWQEYGITNYADLDVIADSIIFPMHMALKRALEESEKKFLSKVSFESINKGGAQVDKPKKGLREFFKL